LDSVGLCCGLGFLECQVGGCERISGVVGLVDEVRADFFLK
jgi:hypothetical protein